MKEAKAKEMFLNREICLVNDKSEKLKRLLMKWLKSEQYVFRHKFLRKHKNFNSIIPSVSTSIPSIFVDDIEIEEENILEAGRWYETDNFILYYKGNDMCFWFEKESGCWYDDCIHNTHEHIKDNYKPISESEVLPYLTEIAKKRGYKEGVYVEEFYLKNIFPMQSEVCMLAGKDFWMEDICIMHDGKWAKIIN